ncbi:MAG TPA: 3-isopropylmalate dehydratase small subunit [Candidatus Limnocylindrales bacterium]|nr:3-isopropylmalate dehydratase small subunit [Candidatus Limnocylindrales bacterium]
MALAKITTVTGRGVYVPGNDIDTDRIIPAAYMKCVTFDGLGARLFHDVRFDRDGNALAHPLNDARFAGASILISNQNFGCGSSREHAPQAIAKAGFKAVIAEGFAEIFFGNSTTLGLPCVVLTPADVRRLADLVESAPQTAITIDLEAEQVRAGDLVLPLAIKPAAREALMTGQWDPIGQLLEGKPQIARTAESLPYLHF